MQGGKRERLLPSLKPLEGLQGLRRTKDISVGQG